LDDGLTRVFRIIGVRSQLSMPGGSSVSGTGIRLIDVGDADAIAAHRARDADAFARRERLGRRTSTPRTGSASGSSSRDDHRNGDRLPDVVLADGT
jgi:hypothetical protein